jgi:hypothetical protein
MPTKAVYQFDHEVFVELDAGAALVPNRLLNTCIVAASIVFLVVGQHGLANL